MRGWSRLLLALAVVSLAGVPALAQDVGDLGGTWWRFDGHLESMVKKVMGGRESVRQWVDVVPEDNTGLNDWVDIYFADDGSCMLRYYDQKVDLDHDGRSNDARWVNFEKSCSWEVQTKHGKRKLYVTFDDQDWIFRRAWWLGTHPHDVLGNPYPYDSFNLEEVKKYKPLGRKLKSTDRIDFAFKGKAKMSGPVFFDMAVGTRKVKIRFTGSGTPTSPPAWAGTEVGAPGDSFDYISSDGGQPG